MGAGSMIFPLLVSFALKENQALWFVAMLAVAIFSALTIYLQYLFTRERVTEELAGQAKADEKKPAPSHWPSAEGRHRGEDVVDRHAVLHRLPSGAAL